MNEGPKNDRSIRNQSRSRYKRTACAVVEPLEAAQMLSFRKRQKVKLRCGPETRVIDVKVGQVLVNKSQANLLLIRLYYCFQDLKAGFKIDSSYMYIFRCSLLYCN